MCLSLVFGGSICAVSATENKDIIEEQILQQFDELQNNITANLRVENQRYVYDYETIHNLIINYDLEPLNEVLGTNYTHDSLEALMLNDIEKTVIQPQVYSTYCKDSGQLWGWNYDRYLTTKQETENWASALDAEAIKEGTLSVITAFAGPFGRAIGTISGIKGLYRSLLSRDLRSVNKESDCGVVTDINRYSSWYTITNQLYF